MPEYLGHLDSLKVDLKNACENMPYLGMDESCELDLKKLVGLFEKNLIFVFR